MMIKNKIRFTSSLISIAGLTILLLSYYIHASVIFIKGMFFTSLLFIGIGLVFSFFAIIRKEHGLFKYSAIAVPVLILLGVALVPLFMGMFGFNNP